MRDFVKLYIRLVGGASRPLPGQRAWNEHKGGPETLLRWLETQLGFLEEEVPLSTMVREYASTLEQVQNACFIPSLQVDRWATATELLQRRIELRLAGWNETDNEALPSLVRDLGRVSAASDELRPDAAARLKRIIGALRNGQILPPHLCILWDPLERWPPLWREVLAFLQTQPAPVVTPQAMPGTALASLQEQLSSGSVEAVTADRSLRWVRCRSFLGACEAIAVALVEEMDLLCDTAVYCENPTTALCLDGCLSRLRLPTMGAWTNTLSHPILQVLPLTIKLCWKPVDPELLLDYLSLPVGPIPRRAARRLAEALAQQPGLGSAAWEKTWHELCDPENDPGGRLNVQLGRWLYCDGKEYGESLPVPLVVERCKLVAQWAAGRAEALEATNEGSSELIESLWIAASQASMLKELAASQGNTVSEPQLGRMLDAAVVKGIRVQSHMEAAGGPRLVTSLSEITSPIRRLIWLGVGTEDRPGCRWTTLELQQLRKCGIDIDDGSQALSALREAERRGLCWVTESLVAVSLPSDVELRAHPAWQQFQNALEAGGQSQPLSLEDLLLNRETTEIEPWQLPTDTSNVQPPQPARPLWRLDPALIEDRSTSSATELTVRLACPLGWVFQYAARLRSSPIAHLPDGFLLKGNFCHTILQAVFGKGGSLLDTKSIMQIVARIFDERLPLDAAPLAKPGRMSERLCLREELMAATRALTETLHAGGYRVVDMELPLTAPIDGKTLKGFIDCLVCCPDGEEAIIDFKYMGRRKYRRLLEEGRAVQLATYSYARSHARHGGFPKVAYLIIGDGLIYSPLGSLLRGYERSTGIDGPAIEDVWNEFFLAIQGAESWMREKSGIPGRPLQNPKDWPPGADKVIEGPGTNKPLDEWEPCRFCEYQVLCGLKELR